MPIFIKLGTSQNCKKKVNLAGMKLGISNVLNEEWIQFFSFLGIFNLYIAVSWWELLKLTDILVGVFALVIGGIGRKAKDAQK